MTIFYALLMIMGTAAVLAAALKEKAEKVFPCLLLSVIVILYPFYCMDMLRLGRMVVYAAFAAAVILSAMVMHRQKRPFLRETLRTLTPAIWIYGILCVFFCFYTRNNLVGLWDELRLWGAVPKALYVTEALQVGEEALIFRHMQSYPPGMPLLIYFMTALSPTFVEGHIFAVYAILYASCILPALQNMKWRHWPFFAPAFVLMAYIPCVLTSHGGDYGWFYESLFIDPVLGALAGYTFYLAASRPFETPFSRYSFAAALLALTILKDSGAMFALVAGLSAVAVYAAFNRKRLNWKSIALTVFRVVLPVAVGYFLWKMVLGKFGVSSNESNYLKSLPPLGSLIALVRQLRAQPMVVLEDLLFRGKLTLTYIPCFLLIFALSMVFLKKADMGRKMEVGITWAGLCLSVGLFMVGYIISYHDAIPSFQRYLSSTLTCALVFTLLHGGEVLFVPRIRRKQKWEWVGRSALVMLGAAMVLSICMSLAQWRGKKYNIDYAMEPARPVVSAAISKIEGDPENPKNVYLLISDNPRSFSLAHHRIYYELMGSAGCVRNFWYDVNMADTVETPEVWTEEEIGPTAQKWAERLKYYGYDYVCIVSVNEYSLAVLREFDIQDAAPGDVYAIEIRDGKLTFVKA